MRAFLILLLSSAAAQAGTTRGAVLREQDLRVQDSPILKKAAADPSPETRKAALLAMGRIQSEAYLKPLLKGLSDPDAGVQMEAIFALGQLGLAEPAVSSTTLLMATLSLGRYARGFVTLPDGYGTFAKDHSVADERWFAAVEALGKTGGPEAGQLLDAYLSYSMGDVIITPDPSPRLREEAALALFRRRFLKRVPEYSTAEVRGLTALFQDRDPETRWRAVYAFSRFPEPRAAAALEKAAGDADSRVRFFACRALGLLGPGTSWRALVKDVDDPEELVRAEAVKALGLIRQAQRLSPRVMADHSSHVRAANVDALAALENGADIVGSLGLIDEFLTDKSVMVRGQAVLALPRLDPKEAPELLEKARKDPSWWIRSKAYEALGQMPETPGLLEEGLKDPDARVASAALEALAKSSSTEVDGILEKVLRDPKASLELAGTAADAAADRKSPALLSAVRAAHAGPLAARYPELRDSLAQAYDDTLKAHPEAKAPPLGKAKKRSLAVSAILEKKTAPSTIVLETERGRVEIELAVAEVPIHAATILDRVKKGLYDGTVWHRVVSGFVVQGGDPRGSGWGDGGVSLRDEINRLPYERGAVGMPKAGKDTGGCQLFISVVPTPHLDGRYTVFGRVSSGMEVVDRLEPGDRIRRAYVHRALPNARATP